MINSINFLGQIHSVNKSEKPSSCKTKPLEYDTFERSSANKKAKSAYDIETVKGSIREENLIGSGFSNTVYKIDGTDDYVIRISRTAGKDAIISGEYETEDVEDKALTGNYGQVVALLTPKDRINAPTIEILKKQSGITNGNPPSSAIYFENGDLRPGEATYEALERKEHYAKTLQILADMPQSAYEDLIDKFEELDRAGYRFDYYNPNNFLLDEENQSINIIDLEKPGSTYKNDLGNALWALSNIGYLNTYMSSHDESSGFISDDDKNRAFKNTMTVIDKFTKALIAKGKKYSKDGYEFYTEVLNGMPMSFYLKTMDIREKENKLREMGVLE